MSSDDSNSASFLRNGHVIAYSISIKSAQADNFDGVDFRKRGWRYGGQVVYGVVHHAIKRYGSPPAAIPRRATRRVATRQMPQAYPPQRGISKRATKMNARTASLAVVMTGALPPYPRDLAHCGRQQRGGACGEATVPWCKLGVPPRRTGQCGDATRAPSAGPYGTGGVFGRRLLCFTSLKPQRQRRNPHPMLAAPKRKISGVRGQSPCHHTRRRSRHCVFVNAERAAVRPAAIPSRATRRIATRQMPQAYPPQRGTGNRATKANAATASLAVVMTGSPSLTFSAVFPVSAMWVGCRGNAGRDAPMWHCEVMRTRQSGHLCWAAAASPRISARPPLNTRPRPQQ